MFGGQVRTGSKKVDGFVRALSQYGEVYEGGFKEGAKEGFGRMISSNGEVKIGWWRDGWLYGNSRKYLANGKVDQEGWFEQYGTKAAGQDGHFRKVTSDYHYWKMKDKYFMKI